MRSTHVPTTLALVLLATCAGVADAAKRRVPKEYATIQAAVTAAAPFDVVEISKGTYTEQVDVIGKTDLTLRARKGHKVIIDGTGEDYALNLQSSNRIVVKRLRLRTALAAVLRVYSSHDVLIDSCRVQDGLDGITIRYSDDAIVRDCRVADVDDRGVYFHDSLGLLERSAIRSTGGSGVCISTHDAITIRWNTIEETGAHGIESRTLTSAGSLLLGNEIRGTGGDGVHLDEAAKNVSVLENVIADTGSDGIEARGTTPHTIDGNSVKNATAQGIEVRAGGSLVCRNKTKSCADGYLVMEDGCMIVDNKAIKTDVIGFAIGSDDNVLIGNVAKKSDTLGLIDAGTDNHYMANTFDSGGP